MKWLIVSPILAMLLPLGIAGIGGCAREVYHSEKTSPTWTGGTKHEATTVTKNLDGSTNVEHEKQVSHP